MNRCLYFVAGAVVLTGALTAPAQDAKVEEDLRFVRDLRARHYSDLAMKYLERIRATASPELARELPLEIARTRLALASDEPDSAKRLRLFDAARVELEKFLHENANHPRAAEARLDIAEVTVLQGKTQLSRALLQETPEAREAEAVRARALFMTADGQLRAAADELGKQVKGMEPKSPAEQAAYRKLEQAYKRALLAVALNTFDQAMSFVNEGKEGQDKLRADKVQQAQKLLAPLVNGASTDPIAWEAAAWMGRCQDQLGDPQAARKTYDMILQAPGQAPATGRRLARYFDLLAHEQTVDPNEKKLLPAAVLESTERWLREYASYSRTPEANGVRYLRAEYLLKAADSPQAGLARQRYLLEARRLLGEIERNENDFTDRAKRLKLTAIAKQGGFSKKIEQLKSFEDCYIRAQYEISQAGEDARKLQGDDLQKSRKEHRATILKALERALAMDDASRFPIERNNAQAMLTFYCFEARDYRKAIEVGETFARKDPRSSQAAVAAVYALQAYTSLIKEQEKEEAEEVKELRERMHALAKYMIERWPTELAGNVGRHELALGLLREDRIAEGIAMLDRITPDYPSYPYAQYQLATAALYADKNNAPLIEGDKAGGYRQRALAALQKIPDPVPGASPFLQNIYVQAKTLLGYQLFRDKKYGDMRALAARVRGQLGQLKLAETANGDSKLRNEVWDKLVDQELLGIYGEADAAFKAGKHAEVASLLDKQVAAFNEGKFEQMKKNVPVSIALMNMDLQSSVQLGHMEQANAVLKALQSLHEEKGADKGVDTILAQLAVVIRKQVEELQKKKSDAELKSAVANYKTLINNVVKTQKNTTTRLKLVLAQCYSAMGEHGEAVKLVEAIPPPKEGADPGSEEVREYRGSRLLLVRELRQTGDPDKVKKAADELDEIVKSWGGKNLDVLLEQVRVFEERKEYAAGARQANMLVRALLKKIGDNTLREKYLESYYHMVYCIYKHAQSQDDSAKKEKGIREAAQMIVQLEKKRDGFGSEASRKRFEDLLARESELKDEYTKAKGE